MVSQVVGKSLILVIIITLSPIQELWASSCSKNGNWLQILGSGGPEVQDKRASSSYLIWIDGEAKLLIDAGGGSALRFGQSEAKVATLGAVLFSHLHVDHSADFPALIKSSFFEDRSTALPVFGPDGNNLLPSTTDFITRLFSDDGVWPYLGHFLPGQRHFSYELQANN
ncbi:MAG: MBL fold metallo-hydrolase, partial [Gammaproteobacteria bacterium]|nr:MBL fold metallo-hydrolase [Gammaproteobacteria bacterium]